MLLIVDIYTKPGIKQRTVCMEKAWLLPNASASKLLHILSFGDNRTTTNDRCTDFDGFSEQYLKSYSGIYTFLFCFVLMVFMKILFLFSDKHSPIDSLELTKSSKDHLLQRSLFSHSLLIYIHQVK